jgi:hypothetical protein
VRLYTGLGGWFIPGVLSIAGGIFLAGQVLSWIENRHFFRNKRPGGDICPAIPEQAPEILYHRLPPERPLIEYQTKNWKISPKHINSGEIIYD